MTGSRDIEGMFVFTLSSGVIMGYPIVDAIDAFKMAYPELRGVYFVWQDGFLAPRMVDNL